MKLRNGLQDSSHDLPLTAHGRVDGRSARKVETRRRIITAASELFAEQGYTGTSMDQIADTAGVSKGTIFYNYKNKADLFEHLVLEAAQSIGNEIQAAREGRHGWAALSEAVWRLLSAADSAPAPAQIIITELFRRTRPWAESLERSREIMVQPLLEILQEVAEERQQELGSSAVEAIFRPNVAMPLLGAVVLGALDRREYTPHLSLEEEHAALMSTITAPNIKRVPIR